jgi:23S rRNA (guanine745-N1)-methyltransferase
MTYQCPLCLEPLDLQDKSLICCNHHQFDMAKEGYVNLMPVQHKHSKDPGDNKEMMQARRRFLTNGYYNELRSKVAELCQIHLQNSAYRLLDIGCGEGYYTHFITEQLKAQESQAIVYGLDISKVAIRYAAKRHKNTKFCVASSHRLPFSDQSLDAVLRIYAPCKSSELQRCLTNQGIVITVTPAARHLYQLKEMIYQEVTLHDEDPENIDGFQLMHQEKLSYSMTLPGLDALDLLQMTPFAWRASEEVKAQLNHSAQFSCETDFMIRIFNKITQ